MIDGFHPFCRSVSFEIGTTRSIDYARGVVFHGQYTRCAYVAGLLLRAFDRVGRATFFLIYCVLSPSGHVKIVARFNFRHFIGNIRRGDFLSFYLVSAFFVLLELVEFKCRGIVSALKVEVKDERNLSVDN